MSDYSGDTFPPRSVRPATAESLGDQESGGYQPYGTEDYFGEDFRTLTFRLKDGRQFAKPYLWLGEISFDPAIGITLEYSDKVVSLAGRHLAQLYRHLCDYKVHWIQEADRPTGLLIPEHATVVETISYGTRRDW